MSEVKLGDSIYLHIGTADPSTGSATNADALPTVTIEEDGVAMGYSPVVTNVMTGLYRVTIDVTIGNGFEAGKRYSAYVSATVLTIAGVDSLIDFLCMNRETDDLAPASTAFYDGVWFDGIGGAVGTAFPKGTPADPINN